MNFISKLLGGHDRVIGAMEKRAERVLAFDEQMAALTDEQLRAKTVEFKERLESGATLDSLLEEAFAVVREASHRVLGMKHFKVQIIGGIVLHEGSVAEMKTGEGKTLVATLPSYLNALTGEGVFVITVNDYLARRDREEMGRIHEFLGLSVGLIEREMSTAEKRLAYECDITYGTNSEFGFDYLRDNMAFTKEGIVQRSKNYAIIDEVDSILIDEARTPLIITGHGGRPSQYYITVDKFVKSLKEGEHYDFDSNTKQVSLSDEGMDRAEKFFGLSHIADSSNVELLHHIRQGLHANYGMKKDQDYVVKDGEILIVDKFTGRLMPGRRFSNGLHQAIEAKEGVEIQKESNTFATITYQNYFRMFSKIGGMTGTAYSERAEIKDIYGMEVLVIPTNNPVRRADMPDKLFRSKEAKLKAIVEQIKERHAKGQPVLVGTILIDQSEKISELLSREGIKHSLLNAKQDKNEAHIISLAGQRGAVTIATNMAGRGTDIKLGEGVVELGGLFVLGTERHDSRRIDNQLRGRSGRQGDPGESQFYVSLEDSLFEKIDKERVEKIWAMIERAGFKEDEAIEDKLISKAVESVQNTVENMNFRIRKSTLEFDRILNKQRETIYNERNKILNGEDKSEFIRAIIKDVVEEAVNVHTQMSQYPEEWDLDNLEKYLNDVLGFKGRSGLAELSVQEIENLEKDKLTQELVSKGLSIYEEKESLFETKELRYVERLTLMRCIDNKWTEHLDLVEQMRQGISLQYVGQQDPVRVFNEEAFSMFEDMMQAIKEEAVRLIFSLATKEMVQSDLQKKAELKESERLERIAELEDKYKLDRRHVAKVPSNLPQISFNVDINATEDIEVEYALYFMENGFEEKVESLSKKLIVSGSFPVQFEKPGDKDWLMGWHQIKIYVAGQEATAVNFVVTEPVDLEKLKVQQEEKNRASQQVRFFSEKLATIPFTFELPGFKGDSIPAALAFGGNMKGASKFEVPVKDSKASLIMNRPENGWKKGLYKLVLQAEGAAGVVVPFMIVEEHSRENDISIKLSFNMEFEGAETGAEGASEAQGEKRQIQLLGQLISLETMKAVANVPINVESSGNIELKFAPGEAGWMSGRYEFRLLGGGKLIITRHFLVA